MNRLAILALPLLLLVAAPARAADRTFDSEAAAKAIAPFSTSAPSLSRTSI